MKDQRKIDIKDRGFQVNIELEEPMNNEKAKNAKQGCKKLRSWEYENHISAKQFLKLVWKIHEVARGKGLLSWNWGVPLCEDSLEELWTNLEGSWNW